MSMDFYCESLCKYKCSIVCRMATTNLKML